MIRSQLGIVWLCLVCVGVSPVPAAETAEEVQGILHEAKLEAGSIYAQSRALTRLASPRTPRPSTAAWAGFGA